MTYFFLEVLIFFSLTPVNIYALKKYCIQIQTPQEINHETDSNRYTFSLASDFDAETSFFLCRVKILYQKLTNFLSFMMEP